MTNPYTEWFEQVRAEYGEQLRQMPLPDGLPEHLERLVAQGDSEAITFMLKIAWQFGAQAGFAAGQQQSREGKEGMLKPKRSSVQA